MTPDGPKQRARPPTAPTVESVTATRISGEPPAKPLTGALQSGEVLAGRYRIGSLLGRGGMGEVYTAHDVELDEQVALKLLRTELSSEAGYRQRLRSEVRLARRVSHPNVCRVHDLGQHNDHLFVTMERVPGKSLRQVQRAIRTGDAPPLTLTTIVDIMSQLCGALAAAHNAGVLHKDVKPDNVIVDDGRVVLTDFGVASLAGELGDRTVAGTPAYAAPEVLRGEPCDKRADVYSASVVAFELVAGTTPYVINSMRHATRRALDRELPPPLPESAASAGQRAALDRVLAAGLASEPADRLASVEMLAEGLAAALRHPADPADLPAAGPAAAPLPDAFTAAAVGRRRVEARVATVLTFYGEGATDEVFTLDPGATTDAGSGLDQPGDELERVVVDLGGWPIVAGAGSITALFGVPVALGDDAVRAVRAARALLATSGGGRAGIDTTRVMIRPGMNDPVAPEVARLADALASAAPAGQLLLTAAAARQVAAHVDVEAAPDVGDHRVVRVTGDAPVQAGGSRAVVARPRELARLEALARTCFETRTPRLIEVRGPSGSGKTRLRAAFAGRVAERRDVDWLVAAAAPLGEAAALSLLRTANPDWFEAAWRGQAGAGADRAATLAAARRWLEERAALRPVAVLFDDVQWADEMSRALVADLATQLDGVPVLVVTLSREPVGLPGAELIELGPLDDGTALRLAREVAPGADDDQLSEVVARAGGNPFFVEELAREVIERGSGHGTLPPTVEAAVQARLERLSAVAADLLGAGAVVGRGFWREAARVALPAPVDDADLDAGLAELERRGLVFPAPPSGIDDDRYEFAQALVRDVAYQRLSPRDRRRAHAAVARWLGARLDASSAVTLSTPTTTGRSPATDPDLLWALAHHREHGGDLAGAALSWRVAGQRSLDLFAYQQAHAALARAWDLAGDTADASLAERLGDAAFEAHTLDAAAAAFEAAMARLEPDDDAGRARIYYRLGQVASTAADHAAALGFYQKGLDLVAPGGQLTLAARRDPRQAAMLFGSMGWVRSYQLGSDDPEGLAACQRAVELLEGTAHRRELAHALSRLGGAYMRAGRWRDQLRCNQRNLEIALELNDLQATITGRINLGVVLSNLGKVDEAIVHTEQALELCRRAGTRPTTALCLSNLGGYLLERGDLVSADRRVTDGIRLAEQVGQRRILPESYQFLARIAARRGDLDAAHLAARGAIAVAHAAGVDPEVGVGHRILAQIESRRGAAAEAEAALAEAARLLDDSDEYERARLDAARARIWRRAGRTADATAAAVRAAAVFDRLGARPDRAALEDDDEVR